MDNNTRGKSEENKNPTCCFCGKTRSDCPRQLQIYEFFNRNDISDDDFVENHYGYGSKKEETNVATPPKAKTKTKTRVPSKMKEKIF